MAPHWPGFSRIYWTNTPFQYLWLSAAAGYFLHLVLDLLNSYGMQAAYPCHPHRMAYLSG
ncbi:hypothetical protein E5161_01315 [Cohnella pontilimi]|uniref:Metal-dependent hydrolase n=1 Tax=Cohnella pontilimi TaxID=2564100 RepID=A0A4U0FGK3_9BACL|nr:hypothetical protein E5161_01315 [Cohnella pontilimi]